MSIQLHEMDQYASGIYGSFSGNQYGIDTGIIEFPDTIRVVSQEKSKRIYHNPARLPSREQFSQDIQNGAEGMKEINRLLEWWAFPSSRLDDLRGRKAIPVPYTDSIIDGVIRKVGGEEKFKKLLQSGNTTKTVQREGDIINTPMIKIIGSEYRCKDPRIESLVEFIPFPASQILGIQYAPCMFEEKVEMFLNTHNTRKMLLESDTDQEIVIKVFPVDPKKYKFRTSAYGTYDTSPIGLIDPILDYYLIQPTESVYSWSGDIQRKQMIYSYVLTEGLYKKGVFTQYITYPYYEIPISIKKGMNPLTIEYYSYTPTDGDAFFIVE